MIVKSFKKGVPDNMLLLKSGAEVISFVSFERLLPVLQKLVSVRVNEKIAGIRVAQNGITCIIERS